MSGMFEFPAVLTREMFVRLIDISRSGCRLETNRRIDVGTIGRLRVKLGTKEYEDDVEVVRCESVEGGGVYHVGMRLLWTTPQHHGSIRHAVTREMAAHGHSDTGQVM